MKKLIVLVLLLGVLSVGAEDKKVTLPDGQTAVLHDDFTWEYLQPQGAIDTSSIHDNEIPTFLRGGISTDKQTLIAAVELYSQGWRYHMPQPKSRQAAWGNGDGRTTWFYGFWDNAKTGGTSKTDPVRRANGTYYGDSQDLRNTWRNGGSPPIPTALEWLLSASGGIPPN